MQQLGSRTKFSRKSNYPRVSPPYLSEVAGGMRRDAFVAQFHARSPIERPYLRSPAGCSARRRFQLSQGPTDRRRFVWVVCEATDRNQRYNTWTRTPSTAARAAILISLE